MHCQIWEEEEGNLKKLKFGEVAVVVVVEEEVVGPLLLLLLLHHQPLCWV